MSHPSPLETYLRELRDGRAIGVAETSFYAPLANLLNAVGATLKPKVRCIVHPRNLGAGIPDGGFYTPDQLAKHADAATIDGQVLVTNYRDFLLVGRDSAGRPRPLERYRLASSDAAFWSALSDPRALAEEHAERLAEYLRRVMLSRASLADPRDVAAFL